MDHLVIHLDLTTAYTVKEQFWKRWLENTSFRLSQRATTCGDATTDLSWNARIGRRFAFSSFRHSRAGTSSNRSVAAHFRALCNRLRNLYSRYINTTITVYHSSLNHCNIRSTQIDRFLRFSFQLFDFSSISVIMWLWGWFQIPGTVELATLDKHLWTYVTYYTWVLALRRYGFQLLCFCLVFETFLNLTFGFIQFNLMLWRVLNLFLFTVVSFCSLQESAKSELLTCDFVIVQLNNIDRNSGDLF